MTRNRTIGLLVFLFVIAPAVDAQILNGSFESGTTNWTIPSSQATVYTTNTPSSLLPSHGGWYLILDTDLTGGAIAGHGPHPAGSPGVAQIYQDFTKPLGGACSLSLDWEFALNEPQHGAFNDFLSIDVLNATTNALVANVVFIDNGFSAGSPSYTNIPGAGGGLLTWAPNQTGYGGLFVPAPAGFKRARVDLSSVPTGTPLRLAISVGNDSDALGDSFVLIDNVRLDIGQRNTFAAGLRVFSSLHDAELADATSFTSTEAPFEYHCCPGQTFALKADGVPGMGWALAAGPLNPFGTPILGFGVTNLRLTPAPVIVINGLSPTSPIDQVIGMLDPWGRASISGHVNDLQSPFSIGVQAAMVDPYSPPYFLRASSATEVIVGPPRMPLGTSDVLNATGSAISDDDFGAIGLAALNGGAGFPFYGTSRTQAFVGDNGYITFVAGDTDYEGTIGEFLVQEPRISPLWADLEPDADSRIRSTVTSDTVTVSWESLGKWHFAQDGNNFAVQFYDNGVVTMYFESTDVMDALTGMSPGGQMGLLIVSVLTDDFSTDWASFGNRRGATYQDAFFQVFGNFIPLGASIDPPDLIEIGRSGPSRITFAPDGVGGYTYFTGTR